MDLEESKTILVTGFAPFGGETVNPSFEAVKGLPESILDCRIVKAQLPVEYDGSLKELDRLIESLQPDMILCTGQAGGRGAITPEYVAINLQNSEMADNADVIRKEQPVCAGGADAYFSNLPVFEIVRAMQAKGISAQVSYSAGTYVCNTVMYQVMHYIKEAKKQVLGGFIHVPFSCEQTVGKGEGTPSLSILKMREALQCAIETSINKALYI